MPTSPAVRAAAAFLASRIALGATLLVMAAAAGQGAVDHEWATGTWWLDRFAAWDSYHYVRIATLGYLPPGLDCCDQAFFPGYPATMAATAPVLGGNVTAAGLLVSLVAGAVAAGLLWRLVTDDARGGPLAASRAVWLLALLPTGFFLVAIYTEALFLALALGAWLLATRRHWWWAGLLAALATGVRVNGLFLAAGLVVLYAVQWHRDGRPRPRWDVLALGLPAVPVAAFVTYLHARTGSWNA
ncbi:mannosyltransferase PIG-V [Knoellia remsis]|uniref:Mannosyltransferase PIG-V n=1 Tax=Knoellia remsis TaxID=407159 RepID=A0A2T0UNB3_9MICO|nr:mannosyltransferase family protein [Knoellia remsis]PRY59419.1 mannosyltransferase PIG-V [Knoellia remsis]